MIKQFSMASVLLSTLAVAGCSSDNDDDRVDPTPVDATGDTIVIANTFEDTGITGGEQTIYGLSEPVAVSGTEVELPGFINFYDIDVSADSITMKLINNSDAADLVLPEGRFDRYYVGFTNSDITSVSLDGTEQLNTHTTVSLLPAGFTLNAVDIFQVGIEVPVNFDNGGILIELGAGTDLTELNQFVKVKFQ